MTNIYATLTPLELYERVQANFHYAIQASRGAALATTEQMLRSRPAIAPYWMLPWGTPSEARVCR